MSHTYLAMFVPYTQQVILLHSNREIRDLNPLVCFSLDKKLAFGVGHSFPFARFWVLLQRSLGAYGL